MSKNGWNYLTNSPKWHYFAGGRSLCGKFLLFGSNSDAEENDKLDSSDNCKACVAKRKAQLGKARAK